MVSKIRELGGVDDGWFSRWTTIYLPRNCNRDRRSFLIEKAYERLVEDAVRSWPSKQAATVSIDIHVTPKKKEADAERGDCRE